MNETFTYMGYKVIANPALTPPAKLSFSLQCGASKEVIEDMNKWLLSVFGRANEEALVLHSEGLIVVPPEALQKLRAVATRGHYVRA